MPWLSEQNPASKKSPGDLQSTPEEPYGWMKMAKLSGFGKDAFDFSWGRLKVGDSKIKKDGPLLFLTILAFDIFHSLLHSLLFAGLQIHL